MCLERESILETSKQVNWTQDGVSVLSFHRYMEMKPRIFKRMGPYSRTSHLALKYSKRRKYDFMQYKKLTMFPSFQIAFAECLCQSQQLKDAPFLGQTGYVSCKCYFLYPASEQNSSVLPFHDKAIIICFKNCLL